MKMLIEMIIARTKRLILVHCLLRLYMLYMSILNLDIDS